MQICQDNISAKVNGVLTPILGVQVTITDTSTGKLAAIYSDNGVTKIDQPLTTDETGYFGFYAANGRYSLAFTSPQIKLNPRVVQLYDPADDLPLTQSQAAATTGAERIGGTWFGSVIATVAQLATSIGASLIGFTQAGTGAVARSVQDKLRDTVNAKDFGAKGDGVTDDSAAIIAALAAANHVVVSNAGVYRCDTMIELNGSKTLELKGGVTLQRMSAYSASTDPVVWIKGSTAAFFGAGQGVSTVQSQNRAPYGVVRLGHKDMTQSHGNVNYCSLSGMTIAGALAYGQTTGAPDVALYMPNPQFGGLSSYYHNISGLRVQDANFGIWLHGWANANTISNIQGFRIGNTTLGANKNAFIFCDGALDNAVGQCFFTSSPDSIGTLVDNFDNTANGGSVHSSYANSFVGVNFEQGGASAYGVKLLAGTRNIFVVRDNVALGNSLADTNNMAFGISNNIYPNQVSSTDYLKSGTYTEATSGFRTSGSYRSGDGVGSFYVAKKVKRVATTNNSTATFTLTCTAQASVWRHGYIRIKVAGGDTGSGASFVAEFMYGAGALNQAYPTLGALKSSSGDTTAYTISMSGNVLTVASTNDTLVCEVEFGFTTTNVDIS